MPGGHGQLLGCSGRPSIQTPNCSPDRAGGRPDTKGPGSALRGPSPWRHNAPGPQPPLSDPPSKNKPRHNFPVQITSCTKLLCAVCRRSRFKWAVNFFQIKLLSMPTKLAAVCPLRSHRRGLLSRRTKKASGRPSRDDSKYRALLCRGKHLLQLSTTWRSPQWPM